MPYLAARGLRGLTEDFTEKLNGQDELANLVVSLPLSLLIMYLGYKARYCLRGVTDVLFGAQAYKLASREIREADLVRKWLYPDRFPGSLNSGSVFLLSLRVVASTICSILLLACQTILKILEGVVFLLLSLITCPLERKRNKLFRMNLGMRFFFLALVPSSVISIIFISIERIVGHILYIAARKLETKSKNPESLEDFSLKSEVRFWNASNAESLLIYLTTRGYIPVSNATLGIECGIRTVGGVHTYSSNSRIRTLLNTCISILGILLFKQNGFSNGSVIKCRNILEDEWWYSNTSRTALIATLAVQQVEIQGGRNIENDDEIKESGNRDITEFNGSVLRLKNPAKTGDLIEYLCNTSFPDERLEVREILMGFTKVARDYVPAQYRKLVLRLDTVKGEQYAEIR